MLFKSSISANVVLGAAHVSVPVNNGQNREDRSNSVLIIKHNGRDNQ